MSRVRRGPRSACALLTVLALAGPGAAQVLPLGLGSVVHAGDVDSWPTVLLALPGAALCFADANGNGTFDAADAAFFQVQGCRGPPAEGDLRLSGPDAGTRVGSADADTRRATLPLPWAARYADLNGDGQWSAGDTLYLQPRGAGSVQPGDLRLTRYGRFGGGSFVTPDDGDMGLATHDRVQVGAFATGAAASWRYWDADGDGRFSPADVLYVDVDGSGDATVMDVRLTPFRGAPFGAVLGPQDLDALPKLQTFVGAEWCAGDAGRTGLYVPGDAVYFVADGCLAAGGRAKSAGEGALRASGPAAGTKVQEGDADFGLPIVQLPAGARLGRVDADGDGLWTAGDPLYVHAAGGDAVAPGDVRLTRFGSLSPGTLVATGSSDVGLPLRDVAEPPLGPVRWWDADGDARFGGTDVLYLDLNADGRVGPGDVRLGVLDGLGFGTGLRMGDLDVRPAFASEPVAWALCRAANGTFPTTYMERAPCRPAAPGDLRLSGPDAGRKIANGDADVNASAEAVPPVLRFFDADNGGSWSLGDTLYLHAAANRSAVAVGDLRLVAYGGYPPGSVVRDADPDLALRTLPLLAASQLTNWHFWDTDGDGRFGGDDVAYVDADASGTISALDVRLGPLPGSLPTATASSEVERLQHEAQAQAERVRGLEAALAEKDATLARLQENVSALRDENARLREAAHPAARTPGPGVPVLGALVALAALARRKAG